MIAMKKDSNKLAERLLKHPSLYARIDQILSIVENPDRKLRRADDAEDRVIEELRELGNEVLTQWAQEESTRCEEDLLKDSDAVIRRGKKNFTGTRPTEK